jgi:hypothetical protein
MRRNQTAPGTFLEYLGRVTIASREAVVVWPGCGDAVAVDFSDDGERYAAVFHLDGTARLDPQPRFHDLLDRQGQLALLANIITIWSETRSVAA